MTTLALIIGVLALLVALAERRHRRIQHRWDDERQRLERYGEHLAAANGRPHTQHLTVVPINGHDHPEPEELA